MSLQRRRQNINSKLCAGNGRKEYFRKERVINNSKCHKDVYMTSIERQTLDGVLERQQQPYKGFNKALGMASALVSSENDLAFALSYRMRAMVAY